MIVPVNRSVGGMTGCLGQVAGSEIMALAGDVRTGRWTTSISALAPSSLEMASVPTASGRSRDLSNTGRLIWLNAPTDRRR
jgi:hypothetical protein